MLHECTAEKAICRHCGKRHHTSMHDTATAYTNRSQAKHSSESFNSRPREDSTGRRPEAGKAGRPGKLSSSPKRKNPKIYSRRQLVHMLEKQEDYEISGTPVDTAFIAMCLESKKSEEFVLEPKMLFI